MKGFLGVDAGWASLLEPWERELIAGLLDQVADILAPEAGSEGTGATAAPAAEPGAPTPGDPPASAAPSRPGESARDAAVLAALDFEPGRSSPDPRALPSPSGPSSSSGPPDASLTPLREVLLPDASEDPDVAVEVGSGSRPRLASLKLDRIHRVSRELRDPSGPSGAVLVRRGEEGQWLGALNDLRLVLAERLGIETAEDAEDVHAMAWDDAAGQAEGETARWRRGIALSFAMVSWWQESLVTALLRGEGAT